MPATQDYTEPIEHIERMLAADTAFEHVEAYIEARRDLSDDQRSALWLLAWCETSEDNRRTVVRSLLAELAVLMR